MQLTFYKYQGTGNDFILIDNRVGQIVLNKKEIAFLCNRKFGIGADGLIFLNYKEGYDFEMIYYNADGSPSTMCGNGGRCMVQFAFDLGIVKTDYHFLAVDGEHIAIIENNLIKLKMQNVNLVEIKNGSFILNTGSPHYVIFKNDVQLLNVKQAGSLIRRSQQFEQYGINVNFVEKINSHTIFVRTYERGVEDETLSCGTGVTAAALVYSNFLGNNNVHVETLGGKLNVTFNKISKNQFEDIYLCGPATFVFKGDINTQKNDSIL